MLQPVHTPVPIPRRGRLRRDGDVWALQLDARVVHLLDAKGLRHLAVLLARPGEPISALELAGGATPLRPLGGEAERARVNVTRTLRATLQRIANYDEALAFELEATIQTGTRCCFRPDPRHPTAWTVEP